MQSELTQSQRLTALLALLDETIRLDEERTQGEWVASNNRDGYYADTPCLVKCNGREVVGPRQLGYPAVPKYETTSNASFIASASISHGPNARALKEELLFWQPIAANSYDGNERWELANSRIRSIISMYPDSILIPYLKPA